MFILVTLTFMFVVLSYIYILDCIKRRRLPPGPKGLPFLGNINLLFQDRLHEVFRKYSKRYGKMITVRVLGETTVVLCSAKFVRDAFNSRHTKSIFANKPKSFLGRKMFYNYGVLTFAPMSDTVPLRRKMAQKSLRMHDVDGISRMEETLLQLAGQFRDEVVVYGGKDFCLDPHVFQTLTRVIVFLVQGRNVDWDDPICDVISSAMYTLNGVIDVRTVTLLTRFPWLRFLPGDIRSRYLNATRRLKEFEDKVINEHIKDYQKGKRRGLIDEMYSESQQKDKGKSKSVWITDDIIKGNILEMFGAGILTTRANAASFFLMLMHRQDVQKKIQLEIDGVIGPDNSPALSDKQYMPYTMAAILENLRITSSVPLILPRKITEDVNLNGYVIPKGTQVGINVWACNYDPDTWESPLDFKPERFLSWDGQLLPSSDPTRQNLMVFGAGERACPGESFAVSEMFILISVMLQRLTILPPQSRDLLPYDPNLFVHDPLVLVVPEFYCRAIARSDLRN